MSTRWLTAALIALGLSAYAADQQAPKAGKVEIFPLKEVKAGMHGIAWTVFSGTEPEPVPIEIIGIMRGQTGPQDVILAKMGGKAKGLMSPPACAAARFTSMASWSAPSPCVSACSRPTRSAASRRSSRCSRSTISTSRVQSDARTPKKPAIELPPWRSRANLLGQLVGAGAQSAFPRMPTMMPIDTPLVLSGFSENTVLDIPAAVPSDGNRRRARRRKRGLPDQPSPPRDGRIRSSPAMRYPACWFPATCRRPAWAPSPTTTASTCWPSAIRSSISGPWTCRWRRAKS